MGDGRKRFHGTFSGVYYNTDYLTLRKDGGHLRLNSPEVRQKKKPKGFMVEGELGAFGKSLRGLKMSKSFPGAIPGKIDSSLLLQHDSKIYILCLGLQTSMSVTEPPFSTTFQYASLN